MAPQNSPAPINLFGQHNARQFVGESHRREREQQIGSLAPARWMAVGAANQENQVAALLLMAPQQFRERTGIERLTGWIEQYFRGRGVPDPGIVATGLDFAHLAGRVPVAALDVFRRQGVGVRIARFAGEEKVDLHASVKLNT
jgi:hypothetical protein